jgi:Leucine-rich repeat (LRR) protein
VWIDAGMTPWGEYANTHRDQRGVINHLLWRLTLKVPKPPALPTLKAIAESVYADNSMLDALPPFDRNLDLGVDETSGQPIGKRGTTSDTTPAQFADAVERHVGWWVHQDIEFQFKMATDAKSLAPDTVSLSFIPHLGEGVIARLGALTRLKRLYLRGTAVTDAELASLSGLGQLETFDLSDTGISDKGLEHLTGLHSLKELDLKHTQVTSRGVEQLKSLIPHLKVVRN